MLYVNKLFTILHTIVYKHSCICHNQCHHYSDHGHDCSEQVLDHYNNDNDQLKYDCLPCEDHLLMSLNCH